MLGLGSPVRAARWLILTIGRPALGLALGTGLGLRAVNALHRALPLAQKRRFFYYFHDEPVRPHGRWLAGVAGRTLILPMRRDIPSAWNAALAFNGHDAEVNALYEAVLRSSRPPRAVLDIGANLGLHALKFLAHRARVMAVEPNPACHPYLRDACALNHFPCEIEAVALSDRPGTAELAMPEGRTYLGTTVADVKRQWSDRRVVTLTVPQTTVDELAAAGNIVPDLIKLDTEGSELVILRGARRTLLQARPLIVFESWHGHPDRAAIFALLAEAEYEVQALGLPFRVAPAMTLAEFLTSPASNFLARPAGWRLARARRAEPTAAAQAPAISSIISV